VTNSLVACHALGDESPQRVEFKRSTCARRSGSTWFLAIMHGAIEQTVKIRLAFLGRGKYQATLARDWKYEAAAITIGNASVGSNDSLTIELRAGGGFIGRIAK
jgi:alpha-glucosidase